MSKGSSRSGRRARSGAGCVLAVLLTAAPFAASTATAQLVPPPSASPRPGAGLIEQRVGALTALDRQYMDRQRQRINDLMLRHYGGQCCRREADLDYLQRLLDDRHVRDDQSEELQAMGIVLGDLLAAEIDLDWVVFEDARGRSRALRLDNTDNFLFPVTMISRRREGGDRTPILAIYQQAVDAIAAARPPLPFQ
ncbi:MAG: DUF3806 domain-containing protein [Halieaceae bacterium]|jgi:hypothetical protein|nr:DUF3806 domain-containing protein [Halieaceae bacterium]